MLNRVCSCFHVTNSVGSRFFARFFSYFLKKNNPFRDKILRLWDDLVEIDHLDSKDAHNLQLLERPELGVTFSKLAVWSLSAKFDKYDFLLHQLLF